MLRHRKILKLNLLMKIATVLFIFSFSKSWGQASITATNTPVTDNLTGYLGTSTQPTNWTMSYSSGGPNYNGTTQTTGTTGGWYGNNNMSFLGSGSATNANATWKLQNTSCYTITSFTVSFVARMWKSGSGSPNCTITYSNNSSGTVPAAGALNAIGSFNDATGSIATGTTLTYVISSISIPNNDFIYIRFINAGGSNGDNIGWDDVSISVDGVASCCTAPTTTISPTTQTVCSGSANTLTVTSSATIPSYTWQASSTSGGAYSNVVNGTPAGASYSGTNTAVLTVTAGSTYYYRCLVAENNTCTATSSTSTLVVNTSPTITTQPVNKAVCSGSNASFTVAANGSPLVYQWQEKVGAGAFADITNGGVYSGATTATLVLANPGSGMSTNQYQCIISVVNCSSVTTTAAVLTINTTPAVPPAPSVPSNPACTTGTFSAMTSTVAGVNWYWETTSVGTSTAQPTTTNYTTASTATVYVKALDASGTCWSSSANASVTVNQPDLITAGAGNSSICSETNTNFGVTGLAGATPKKWQMSADNGATFNDVSGAVYSNTATSTLNLTNVPVTFNGYQYQCVVSVPGCPVVTSTVGILTVTQTPSAPPAPTALANPACSSTSLAAMSSTVAGVTWYWQGTTSGGNSTTNPTSSAFNVSASGTYYVRARTDGSTCQSVQSSIAVTINQPPTITSNPSDRTQCVGTNTTFTVSATGTGLTYQWQINTGSGFANLSNSAPYSNVTTAAMSITGITAGMNGYQYQCVVSGASPCASSTSSFATLIITASGEPATAASSPSTNAVACNAFNLTWTNGSGSNRLVVIGSAAIAGAPTDGISYTANTTFGSGGIIVAGEYVVYKGTGNSVFVTGLSASTTYYYKIFEFNGCALDYLTSGTVPNGNITTTSCGSVPGLTAVYIDACGGGCGFEGNNELIWGTTGSYAFKVASNGPTINYNSSSPPSPIVISTYSMNSTNISTLNSAVGSCTNAIFVDPNSQGYIPANSKFLIANNCMCSPSAYDFSGLCNAGPIYVIFGTGPNWPCGSGSGIFGNGNACNSNPRYFDLNLNAWGVALDPIYNYDPCSLSAGSNGDVILLNPSGGAAITYSNTGCIVPLIILPIELLDFYGTQSGSVNNLVWKVASEKNVSQYIIEKSEDGVNFRELTRVNAVGAEDNLLNYSCEDPNPFAGITYYRLSTMENNQKINHYNIIDVDRGNKDWKSLIYQENDQLIVEWKNYVPKDASVVLYDLSGKQLADQNALQAQTKINTNALATGIYFVRISTPYKTENFKVIISK